MKHLHFLLALGAGLLLSACAQVRPSEPPPARPGGLIDQSCPPAMATKGLC